MIWWFACNIHDSGVSEYSTTDTFNSVISKYYVTKNKIKMNGIPDSGVSE
jgi:hypothetical protein